MSVMIALVALVVLAIVIYSVWEIASGLLELIVGLFLCVSGAALYILSYLVEYPVRAIRFLWRYI